jgi:hypothetical protein
MSLARQSVAYDPSAQAEPSYFVRERDRLVEEISTVRRLSALHSSGQLRQRGRMIADAS